MKVREVTCTTALSPSNLPGLDYALNPYRGCSIGCVYCYAPSVLREERPWGRFVDVKRNIPAVLAKELKRKARGMVGLGTVTDGYQPLEGRYHLTRYCLEQLVRFDFPVSVQTKSSLVLNDLDLLRRLSDAEVGVTVTTLDEAQRRHFEPFASPSERRIAALRALNAAGLRTWAFIGPILPVTTEATVEPLLRAVRDAGTRRVLVDRLRFRPGVWERIEPEAAASGLEDRYLKVRDAPDSQSTVETRIRALGQSLGLETELAFPTGW